MKFGKQTSKKKKKTKIEEALSLFVIDCNTLNNYYVCGEKQHCSVFLPSTVRTACQKLNKSAVFSIEFLSELWKMCVKKKQKKKVKTKILITRDIIKCTCVSIYFFTVADKKAYRKQKPNHF